MTIVTAQMSVSVDGFYAGPEHTGTQPWFEGPRPPASSASPGG
jgi:hypothetical protein